jgi:hypothetical protein
MCLGNRGEVCTGTPEEPIGTRGGFVTIHLYGPDQGPGTGKGDGGQGIVCRSPKDPSTGPCGIPLQIWSSNGATKVPLPGGAADDYFYQYHPLPYDDGGAVPGFFGYKVLAVSYGGTLQFFGKKGATYGDVRPSDSGTSWVRLAQTLTPGGTTLLLDRPVDWERGDWIVVTTTDYLSWHAEQLIIATVSPDKQTITVEEPAQHLHGGEAFDLSAATPASGGRLHTGRDTSRCGTLDPQHSYRIRGQRVRCAPAANSCRLCRRQQRLSVFRRS